MHLERHPNRSWGLILQQAWSFCLKDQIRVGATQDTQFSNQGLNKKNRDPCYHYNKGRCNFGDKCKFDHRCVICGKFGHGAFNCRRGMGGGGRENNNNKSDSKFQQGNHQGSRKDGQNGNGSWQ